MGVIDLLHLPDLPALADWLALPLDKLEWLATCGARRRKRPLEQQHYVYQLIPKRSAPARLRLIEAPRIELKAAQHRLLRGLLQKLPVHEACHGFVGGRSVVSHAQAHVGQPLVLRFDLQDFFSHVGEAQVRSVFDTLGFPHGSALRLAGLCVARTPEPVIERLLENGGIDRAQANRLRSAHLPQGAPTSPMLANLCAFRLDLRLAALAAAIGARYTRYADDLVFSGPEPIAALRIEGRIGAIAIEEGFRLNHRKTRRIGAAARQTVAGIVVNQHPNMPRAAFDRLRALLHRCALHGPAMHNVDAHADFQAHLRGRMAWAIQLNPSRARRLRPLWEAIEWS
ncbi:MAG: RNA-directed polymerase [Rhizobacter sp.]|nr:RNA-directed polymerase [Rhizobacter sp.]